jgi:hypothetical protein
MATSRITSVLLLALASAAAAQRANPKLTATIHRDQYGVPHIFAATDEAVLFGMAYALAEDDWPLIEENYVRALGRIAERDGEAGLQADWLARALEIQRLSIDEYKRAAPRLRRLLDAYTAGLNAFVAAHPNIEPRFGRVEPWYPLALICYKYYQLALGFCSSSNGGTQRFQTELAQDFARMWRIVHSHLPASVVVFIIDQISVLALEIEGHAPVAADFNRPGARPITARRLGSSPGRAISLGFTATLRAAEDQPKSGSVLGLNTGCAARFKEAPESLVRDARSSEL